MSSDTLSRLRYMANQIAENLESMGPDGAVQATANHIARFWDPRMKQAIFADARGSGRAALSPTAAAAIDQLAAAQEASHSEAG